ncbi:glucuronate isomerase [Flavobacterium sp. MXW15]|uniref:Uronate isomerase n=1 Tax=Xanthomonas chitinilytica TaxID=2989819 RepID=A0ABT3JX36_9XANT|nr:glucuronate isomerase [Xanthomonas sp. H13-6]MCW4455222.1 glucuronate isomerase [Flavobacterium sp. MXW15]MCW4473049.1 glucuronate isomerase [Xanthomonas sp. H13-6]
MNTAGKPSAPKPLVLDENRLFASDPVQRGIARRLYAQVAGLPIVSPHGHTDPAWFAGNAAFANATELLLVPDHYVFRMLYSHGVPLEQLGIPRADGTRAQVDPRAAWRVFAGHFHLFRGTPSSLWLNHVFHDVFGLRVRLDADSADHYYDTITEALQTPQFRPRALFERFDIEVIATTEGPLDALEHHQAIRDSGWNGRVLTAYRPDAVVDPEHEQFADALQRFGEITGEDVHSWEGYLRAHRNRRDFFARMGATSTDHGHESALTADLSAAEARALFDRIVRGRFSAQEADLFRGQVLTEMAAMSLDDGLVMQLHPGCYRNHNPALFRRYGRNVGADLPLATDYVHALKPLLDRFGNEPDFRLILFTLDESAYSRELGPMAGHYPCLYLGPAWWFHDAPEGMWRFREQTLSSAGFYNTVGFNDDTRAFLSIPARHDVARRVDCAFLARLVAEHRLDEDEAAELAVDLAYRLPKRAYKL